MKKTIALLVLLAGVGVGVAYAAHCHQKTVCAQSIKKVFDDRVNARKSVAPARSRLELMRNNAAFDEKLRTIDTSACPLDFRSAWLDYVHSWDRFAHPTDAFKERQRILRSSDSSSFGFDLGAANGLHSSQSNTTKREQEKLAEASDTQEWFQKCEEVALTYGVQSR